MKCHYGQVYYQFFFIRSKRMLENRQGEKTILIVDDSCLNRKILSNMLMEEFAVREAESGEEAIKILREEGETVRMLLLDMIMPGIDGFGVLQMMNEQGWIDKIPVIVISSVDLPRMIEKAYGLGVVDYISRRETAAMIRQRIKNVMRMFDNQELALRLRQETRWKQSMYQKLAEIPGMVSYDYDVIKDVWTMHISLKNGEIRTITVTQFFDNLDKQEWLHPDSAAILEEAYRKALCKAESGIIEFKGRFFGDDFRWMRSYYTSVADVGGKVYHIVGRADDIEDDIRIRNSWKDRAQRDTMTGLLNHDVSRKKIASSLHRYGYGILMMLDVDNFKEINDVMGHLYGDTVLKQVAQVIRGQFRSEDILGRFGGDEFIVFLPGVSSGKVAEKKAQDILQEMDKIVIPALGPVSCSIGISIAEAGDITTDDLLNQADQALYHVKERGKAGFVIYNNNFESGPRLQMRTSQHR